MALMKNTKKILNKLKTRIWFSIYYGRYQKSKINDKMVFIESRSGSDLARQYSIYHTRTFTES